MTATADQFRTPRTPGIVFHWPRAYDLVAWMLMPGRAFREKLIDLSSVAPGESVLDVGCGTGTLATAVKRRLGRASSVHGIDASPEMIERARRKARRAGVSVDFANAVAESLPFQDASFDAVLSTMMLHCLPADARKRCVHEIRRVLRPNGRLLAIDFGGPVAERRSLIARHVGAHAHFDLRAVLAPLSDAGLDRIESGALGIGDLWFVLARTRVRS